MQPRGVATAQAGFLHTAPWLLAVAAAAWLGAFHLLGPSARPAKTTRVRASFSSFVRIAYAWLLRPDCAFARRILAVPMAGLARHATRSACIYKLAFAVGQRVLPAFAGMRVLYSPRLMLICLFLLTVGCTLRGGHEILAYESYWATTWNVLPWSAVVN